MSRGLIFLDPRHGPVRLGVLTPLRRSPVWARRLRLRLHRWFGPLLAVLGYETERLN